MSSCIARPGSSTASTPSSRSASNSVPQQLEDSAFAPAAKRRTLAASQRSGAPCDLRVRSGRTPIAVVAEHFGSLAYRRAGAPKVRRLHRARCIPKTVTQRAIYFGDAHLADTTTEIEFRVKGTRGVAWILARARAFKNGEGAVPRVLGTLLDITDRKSTESHQQLLMAELDHRVKNILANVAAIARLSSSNAVSIKAFSSALDGRIHAMSAAHDLLRQSSWTGVDLHDSFKARLNPTAPEPITKLRSRASDCVLHRNSRSRWRSSCTSL